MESAAIRSKPDDRLLVRFAPLGFRLAAFLVVASCILLVAQRCSIRPVQSGIARTHHRSCDRAVPIDEADFMDGGRLVIIHLKHSFESLDPPLNP
jgi:hypothetical protein